MNDSIPEVRYFRYFNNLLDGNHILIGGKTGSGKSVLINDFLYNILTFPPTEKQIMLIDPKRVELSWYKNTQHCIAYANNVNDSVDVLNHAIAIMESRYTDMERRHIRTYDGSTVYVIVDELADLMTTDKRRVMPLFQRIAQLGRASKVFLICATQSPSRITIPAALTLNFTCRIALQCFSAIESRQILGVNGAETLPRYGMAYVKDNDGIQKVSIPMASDIELQNRINYWQKKPALRRRFFR